MFIAIIAAITPFLLNGAMELAKLLTTVSSTPGKRFFLALLSILGVVSFGALNGTPLDTGSVSGLVQTAFLSLAAFLAAHGSYSLFSGGTQG